MNYKLKIHPLAKLDLKEISIWYEEVQKGLGKRFLNAVNLQVKTIQQNPNLFQVKYDNTRVALTISFPYLIHFEIFGNEIFIKAIIHTSRKSDKWANRIHS